MEKKYYNDAIIGNKNIVTSYSKKGELLRLYYPNRDSRQFIDKIAMGVKVNDSSIIYLHEDINNVYNQYYTDNTNVLNTEIYNTYFKLKIMQTDFVCIDRDIIIKKYKIKNEHNIELNVDFLIYSKLLSNFNNMVSSKIEDDIFMQYSHNYTYCTFSKLPIKGYRLNNSQNDIKGAILHDKDYIGMANDSAVSFEVGNLKPGESREFEIYIYINDNEKKYKFNEIIQDVKEIKKINTNKEYEKAKKYWQKYLIEHDGLNLIGKNTKNNKSVNTLKLQEILGNTYIEDAIKIYKRSILLFPLLINSQTGGISAAIEIDEQRDMSGRYSYCWPRDAIFVTKALNILKMNEEAEKFYINFAKNTQSENGMWEQRFYTDGRLAPCWGYQIDETASIVYGVYLHYKYTKKKEFLENTYEMCKKAIEFLKEYIDFIVEGKVKSNYKKRFEINESYDLWEMHEGIHLYSLASIYSAFNVMQKINEELNENIEENNNLKKYEHKVKKYCLENLCDNESKILKRNNKDNLIDISMLAAVMPFKMLDMEQEDEKKIIENTVKKMEMTIKTYTNGYLRFENDGYIEGQNPWVIATLWMTLYNIKIGNIEEAKKELELIVKTSTEHGFLAEQIDNEKQKSKWVIGLAWSHAMYITTLYKFK